MCSLQCSFAMLKMAGQVCAWSMLVEQDYDTLEVFSKKRISEAYLIQVHVSVNNYLGLNFR